MAVIVGVGAVLYPIGFIQLVARVALGATNDFSTAWLVASLMPPVQVVGQGVRALAGMWLFLIFLPLFLLLLYRWPLNETRSLREYAFAYLSGWRWIFLVGVIAVVAAITGIVSHFTWQPVVGNVLMMVMGQVIAVLTLTHRARRFIAQLALITAVVYLGTVANIMLNASQHHDPGLPRVAVGSVQGKLVTHADGYWYVLTTTGQLVAVPDDHVTAVTIQP